MGSDSDLGVMQGAMQVLEELQVPYEVTVCSAHRSLERAVAYAQSARGRGLAVIIAGAGLAAHLPGVLAAATTLPVIGVPLVAGTLGGVDALYSIVQMPPGVPVAGVGIGNARNAGLLAAAILSIGDAEVATRLDALRTRQAEAVAARDARLQELGYRAYLEQQRGERR